MATVNSNLFNLPKSYTKEKSDEIINTIENKVDIEEVYKDFSDIISSTLKDYRNTLQIQEIKFTVVDVNKDNFSDIQYDLLKNKNISMFIKDKAYNFITTSGNIYRITNEHLINTILSTPRPRKIVYDNIGTTSSIYSMQLLANILENIKSSSLEELIKKYDFNYIDEIHSLYLLLLIFPKYEKLVYKHQYNKYINLEQTIYNIFKNIDFNIAPEELIARKKSVEKELFNSCESLKITCNPESTEKELLNIITAYKDNDLLYPSLNNDLISSINLTEYHKLINLYNEFSFINNILNNKYSSIDTYFDGQINMYEPLIHNITPNKVIKGSFLHLKENIIAELLNNKVYIDYINNDKNLYFEILNSKGKEMKENVILLLDWIIEGYIQGCNTIDEYKEFIYTNKSTVMNTSDLEFLINILNTDFKDLISSIDSYSERIFSDTLILHNKYPIFYKTYLSLKRKLEKKLIIEVYEYISDFNKKNKVKINFIGYYNDSIYLLCEEGSLSVSMDTLTRTLVTVYDKYLKKTKAHCLVESLNI